MATCDLTIHLEDQRTTYRGGETVRGEVEVRADEDVRCDALVAECRWRTHGKGTSVRGEPIRVELFQGEWRAGTVRRYPFAITLPHGPFTYHGHYLNVVWEVRAEADVPWAFDPKAETEIALAPDPEAAPDWVALVGGEGRVNLLPGELRDRVLKSTGAAPPPSTSKSGGRLGTILGFGCLALFALPLIFLFIAAGVRTVAAFRGEAEPMEALILVAIALAFAGAFGLGSVRVLRNAIARKRLGRVVLEAEPRLVRPGDSVRIDLFCQPNQKTELVSATARLEAEEKVVRGSGTNRRTYRQTVHSETAEIAVGRSLQAGLPFQIQREITVPADAPPSFMARDNELRWTLTVELDVARWPDWGEERALLVHP